MVKITKYLKPFALAITAVIVLLFAQAQCELAPPDYMADIVDVGIQSGGINSAVPEVIRESEAEKLFLFLSDEDAAVSVKLYACRSGTGQRTTAQAGSRGGNRGGLFPQSARRPQMARLEDALTPAEMIVMSLPAVKEKRRIQGHRAAGGCRSDYASMPQLPQDVFDEIVTKINSSMELAGKAPPRWRPHSLLKWNTGR